MQCCFDPLGHSAVKLVPFLLGMVQWSNDVSFLSVMVQLSMLFRSLLDMVPLIMLFRSLLDMVPLIMLFRSLLDMVQLIMLFRSLLGMVQTISIHISSKQRIISCSSKGGRNCSFHQRLLSLHWSLYLFQSAFHFHKKEFQLCVL